MSSPAAQAQTYVEQTLHDGVGASGLVLMNGILYGTTADGGGTANNGQGYGTIYSFDPVTHTETILHSFNPDGTEGVNPFGTLVAANGKLYGTTRYGGVNGEGTVFCFDPVTQAESILYSFQALNSGDGVEPVQGLTYDSTTGTLYGTTPQGGANTIGTVFSLKTDGTGYQTLYDVDYTGPEYINSGLIVVNGILYGTSQFGGAVNPPINYTGFGTVFSLDPTTHAVKILYTFQDGSDGGYPGAGLMTLNGKLYGMTSGGGAHNLGTLFSVNLDGSNETVIYNFGNTATDGTNPSSLIAVNGIIYGTTVLGGDDNLGTVFSLNLTTQAEKTLCSFWGFQSGDGSNPGSSLININGIFYGTAGTLYSVAPDSLVAADDSYAPQFETAYGVKAPGVLANDHTNGMGPLTATLFAKPTHGTLTFHSDGSFTYTPNSEYTGSDVFAYYTTNSAGRSNTAAVFLNIRAVVPVAHNDSYPVKYMTGYNVNFPGVISNDYLGEDNFITTTLVTSTKHGTLLFDSHGEFYYVPDAGFVGTDTFTYQDTNPIGTSNIATVSLVIQTSVPTAHDDAYVPIYGHAYAIKAPGVLANDYAGDSGAFTAKLVSTVSHGTLTLNSDGSFLYSPTFGFSGTDSFTYQATNAIGTSNTATVTFTINPVVPIAHNDTYAPKYQTAYGVSAPGVLGNDDDGGTSPMTAALVTSPTHGTLTFNSNGSFTYTPSAGFIGTDTFTYNDTTPTGTGNTATVTLNVTATVPIAHNDSYTVAHNKAYAVKAPGVLGNDYNGDTGTLTASLVTTTAHGILTFNTDGSFNYTPATGYSGTDTFTYQAKNAIGTSNTATVTLTVQ